MEYRLHLTPRLLAVGFFAAAALLVLLFALGFQVGQGMAAQGVPPVAPGQAGAAGVERHGAPAVQPPADAAAARLREALPVPAALPGEAP